MTVFGEDFGRLNPQDSVVQTEFLFVYYDLVFVKGFSQNVQEINNV